MNILISSGATCEPIDSVRVITNLSSGTTGCLIAEEALKKGHHVTFLYSRNSKIPFLHKANSQLIKAASYSQETKISVEQNLDLFYKYSTQLKLIPISTYSEYYKKTLELIGYQNLDCFIAVMAASDFSVKNKTTGKLSSTNKQNLTLQKNNKLVDAVKSIQPDLFLVSFKLLSQNQHHLNNLIEKAYFNLLTQKASLTVGNLTDETFKCVKTFIMSIEKNISIIDRNHLPSTLIETIEDKFDNKYFKTITNQTLEKISQVNSNSPSSFKTNTEKEEITSSVKISKLLEPTINLSLELFNLGLFPPYINKKVLLEGKKIISKELKTKNKEIS